MDLKQSCNVFLSGKQYKEVKELDEDLFELLRRILIDLSQNRAVQVLPTAMELTTVQAAEFLRVSRPYLIKLIDQNEIDYRMVGTHRRIKLEDLIDYSAKQARDR